MSKMIFFSVAGGIVVALVGGVFLWQTGCVPEKASPPSTSDSEKVGSNSDNQVKVVIPSDLDPAEVMTRFVPYIPPWGDKIAGGDPFWKGYFEISRPDEGFVEGFSTSWHGEAYWTKMDGAKIRGPDDPYGLVLLIYMLKYTGLESAQKDYERISNMQEFRDYSVDGFELKTKILMPLPIKTELSWMKIDPDQCQQYLLQSNSFIIYMFGVREAAEDAVIRFVDQYRAKRG